MLLSKKVQNIEPSLTRKLYNMALQYDDVIDLTLGDPDVMPDIRIRDAVCQAVGSGKTHYSANAGLFELRKVIAKHLKREYAEIFDPEGEITVTVGGMEALYLALSAIINDGDEVIIPGPYYVNYVQMVRMCGGVPKIIDTYENNCFVFDCNQIRNLISDRTVAVIINNPANPTGQVLPNDVLDGLAEIIIEKNLLLISDEVYSSLIYDGKKHNSIIGKPGMKNRTVLIDSCSKRFAMTGYRIGYAAGPAEIIGAMTKMQENVAACAPLPSQYAAIEAYSNCYEEHIIHDTFEKRRDYIYKAINKIDGLSALIPAATFYLFVNIQDTYMDSLSYAEELLSKARVAVVPGRTYGKAYDGFVRIAFTKDIDLLEQAVYRIEKFMREIR